MTLLFPIFASALIVSEKQYYALYIKSFFEYRGLDPLPFLKIARCESGFNLKAYNNDTHDSGLMQINKLHWPIMKKMGLDIKDPEDQLIYSLYLYNLNRYTPWSASKKCWDSPSTLKVINALLDT